MHNLVWHTECHLE